MLNSDIMIRFMSGLIAALVMLTVPGAAFATEYKTPDVYIEETNIGPASIEGVESPVNNKGRNAGESSEQFTPPWLKDKKDPDAPSPEHPDDLEEGLNQDNRAKPTGSGSIGDDGMGFINDPMDDRPERFHMNPRTGKFFTKPKTDEEWRLIACEDLPRQKEAVEDEIKSLSEGLRPTVSEQALFILLEPHHRKDISDKDRAEYERQADGVMKRWDMIEKKISSLKALLASIAKKQKECDEFIDGLAREFERNKAEFSSEDFDELIQDPATWDGSSPAPEYILGGEDSGVPNTGNVPDFPPSDTAASAMGGSDKGAGEPASQSETPQEVILPSPYPVTASSETSCLKSLKKPEQVYLDHEKICPRFAGKYGQSCCDAFADYYRKRVESVKMREKAIQSNRMSISDCKKMCDSNTADWRMTVFDNEAQILTVLGDEAGEMDRLNAEMAKLTARKEGAEATLARVNAGRVTYLYENTNSGKLIEHAGNYFDPKPPLRYVGERKEVDKQKRDALKTKISQLAEAIAQINRKKALSSKTRSGYVPYVLPVCSPEVMKQHILACHQQCDVYVDENNFAASYEPPYECARGQSPSLSTRKTHWQLRQYGFELHPNNKMMEDQ